MVRHGYSMLGLRHDAKCFELAEFLVHELGIETWPASRPYKKKLVLLESCHNRILGRSGMIASLLAFIPGAEIQPVQQAEQCCGFGGSFSATQGFLSSSIGIEKLSNVLDSGAEEIIGTDMGCLMHLDGLIRRHQIPLKVKHFAQVLAAVCEP